MLHVKDPDDCSFGNQQECIARKLLVQNLIGMSCAKFPFEEAVRIMLHISKQ